jgi:hypothetical protein
MRGLELLSQSHPPEVPTRSELTELSVQIKYKWPSLRDPLLLEWTETPLVSLDRSGVPWVIGPAEQDPLRSSRGRTVVPRRQRVRLKRIAELGIPFQRLAIAHELDREGPVKQLLPVLHAGPATCTDEIAHRLVGDVPAHPGVGRAVRVLDAAVRGATSAVPINAFITVLDPIIFGVIAPIAPRHGEPCLWYPLVAWRW